MWLITKDYINKPESGERSRVGENSTSYRLDINSSQKAGEKFFLDESEKYEFRLLDDDYTVYFEGLISKKDIEDSPENIAFAPLDFYQESYGVTIMQYRKQRSETWETL